MRPVLAIFVGYFLSILSLFTAYAQPEKIIEVPIKLVNGYGPFSPGFVVQGRVSSHEVEGWNATDLTIKGVPKHWKKVVKKMIWFDARQFLYQNFKQANLSAEFYKDVAQSWGVDTVNRVYSKDPIKCYVYFIFSRDEGKITCMVDTDNDLDFSDEKEFVPAMLNWSKRDSLARTAISVSYQMFLNNSVIDSTLPLMVLQNDQGMLLTNIARHDVAMFRQGEKIINLALMFDDFSAGAFVQTSLVSYDPQNPQTFLPEDVIRQEQYITIGEMVYQNFGVDANNSMLKLKQIGNRKSGEIYSTSKGSKAFDFAGPDFKSGKTISLSQFSGKYVLIDFWGTWCGPCVKELPYLRAAAEQLDSAKFQLIGVVADEDPELFAKALVKHGISWPQLRSDETNNIIKRYNVQGYPTSYLIDPDGIIVAINLRGEDLAEKIGALMKVGPK
jgi:thiol-disulfide isomerase/thioredoxin